MRLVEEVEDHRGMILVACGGIFPEVDMLLLRGLEAMQVEQQIRAAIGGEGDDVHRRARDSRRRRLSRRAPNQYSSFTGSRMMFAFHCSIATCVAFITCSPFTRPFEAHDIHALQPERLAVLGQNLVALDVQFLRPLVALRRFGGDLGSLCAPPPRLWLWRPGAPRARSACSTMSSRSKVPFCTWKSAGMKSSATAPSGTRNSILRSTQPSVFLRVFGAPGAPSVFPRGVLEIHHEPRVEPRLLARLQIAHALPPGQLERLGVRADG